MNIDPLKRKFKSAVRKIDAHKDDIAFATMFVTCISASLYAHSRNKEIARLKSHMKEDCSYIEWIHDRLSDGEVHPAQFYGDSIRIGVKKTEE